MGNGPWAYGPWAMGYWPWAMGHGLWAMGHGQWAMGHGPSAGSFIFCCRRKHPTCSLPPCFRLVPWQQSCGGLSAGYFPGRCESSSDAAAPGDCAHGGASGRGQVGHGHGHGVCSWAHPRSCTPTIRIRIHRFLPFCFRLCPLCYSKAAEDSLLDIFRADAKVLQKLRHPGIVRVVEPLDEGKWAMAMVTEPVFSSVANALGNLQNMSTISPELEKLVRGKEPWGQREPCGGRSPGVAGAGASEGQARPDCRCLW